LNPLVVNMEMRRVMTSRRRECNARVLQDAVAQICTGESGKSAQRAVECNVARRGVLGVRWWGSGGEWTPWGEGDLGVRRGVGGIDL